MILLSNLNSCISYWKNKKNKKSVYKKIEKIERLKIFDFVFLLTRSAFCCSIFTTYYSFLFLVSKPTSRFTFWFFILVGFCLNISHSRFLFLVSSLMSHLWIDRYSDFFVVLFFCSGELKSIDVCIQSHMQPK